MAKAEDKWIKIVKRKRKEILFSNPLIFTYSSQGSYLNTAIEDLLIKLGIIYDRIISSKDTTITNKQETQKALFDVTVKVIDINEQKISDAIVKIVRNGKEIGYYETSSNGEVIFRKKKTGNYELYTSKSGYITNKKEISIGNSSVEITIILKKQK